MRGVFDRMLTPEEAHDIERASPRPRARRAGNARNFINQPQTLVGFLKASGGLRDDPQIKGRDYRTSYPGLINNKRGLSLDHARELAAEAGFFGADIDDKMQNTTISDLLDALESHPVYRTVDQEQAMKWEDAKGAAEFRRRVESERSHVVDYALKNGLPIPDKELTIEAAELMASGEESDYDNAIERAAMRLVGAQAEEDARNGVTPLTERTGIAQSSSRQAARPVAPEPGRPGNRPGSAGDAAGPGQAVSVARAAREQAQWREAAAHARSGGAAPGDAGIEPAPAGEPPSMQMPEKQLGALDSSLREEEERWKAVEPYLDEADRKALNEAMAAQAADGEARANTLRDLMNCLMVAEA